MYSALDHALARLGIDPTQEPEKIAAVISRSSKITVLPDGSAFMAATVPGPEEKTAVSKAWIKNTIAEAKNVSRSSASRHAMEAMDLTAAGKTHAAAKRLTARNAVHEAAGKAEDAARHAHDAREHATNVGKLGLVAGGAAGAAGGLAAGGAAGLATGGAIGAAAMHRHHKKKQEKTAALPTGKDFIRVTEATRRADALGKLGLITGAAGGLAAGGAGGLAAGGAIGAAAMHYRHKKKQEKTAALPAGLGAELLAMASRGRRPLPVSAIVPHTTSGIPMSSLIGHRAPPMPVSAVRGASPAGVAQALTPGMRVAPAELGAALRAKTQARGAAELGNALGMTPPPGANPFVPMTKRASLGAFLFGRR